LEYLEDAFLLFPVTVASPSLRVRRSNPRKCYGVDPALSMVTSLQASRDLGHRLENAVYLELRRRGWSLTYVLTAEGHEVDFLAEHPQRQSELIQVCAELTSPETRHRELRALEEAMTEHGVERSTLVTLHGGETIRLDAGLVQVVPAWRWFLERSGG
jgi:hypothetical protein